MNLEAENLIQFSKNFSNKKEVIFPQPYTNFTQHEILVESFQEGSPISNYLDDQNTKLQGKLARMGIKTILKMVGNLVIFDIWPVLCRIYWFFNYNYRVNCRYLMTISFIVICTLVTFWYKQIMNRLEKLVHGFGNLSIAIIYRLIHAWSFLIAVWWCLSMIVVGKILRMFSVRWSWEKYLHIIFIIFIF